MRDGRTGPLPAAALSLAALLALSCSPGDGRIEIEDRDRTASAGPDGAGDGPGAGSRGVPAFRADSAFALLRRQVAFGPRVPGSEGHARQLDWMTSYLRRRADTLHVRPFRHTGPAGEPLELTNLFAQFRPAARDRVLLIAHWDTRPTADREPDPGLRDQPIPGANDGASGTAVLLELADVLSRHSPPIGVDLLFVDGEDYAPSHMYLGATRFAAHAPPGYEPLYGVVVDMVADESPRFLQEGYSRQYAPEVVDRVWRVAERLGYRDYFPRVEGPAVSDDHLPLNRAGIRTIDIIDFDYGPGNAYWHTLEDDVDHVAPEGLGVVGNVLLGLVFQGG